MIRGVLAAGAFVFTTCAAELRAEELSWPQCLQEAAANNADLRAAQGNLEAARLRVQVARSGYLPQLSAGAAYTDTSGSAVSNPGSSYSTSLNLTQNLFAGFQDEAKIEKETANLEATQASYSGARARLGNDLKTAFAGLVYAQDNVVLAETIVRRRADNLRLVELRFEGGRENKGAYLLTRAAAAQARLELLQARQGLESARQQLARVLGRTSGEGLQVTGDVPVSEPVDAPDFSALARIAPDHQQAQAQEEAAHADVRLSRSGFFPSLNLTGTAAREGPDWTPDGDRRSVGLNLTVPLFSGGRDYYGTQSAAQSYAAASANRVSVEQQTLVQLRQRHASFVEAVERVKVDREFVEAAQTRAEIARARYGTGLMSFEDWDRIENDLILREKAYLQSQRDRVTAEAAWELAQGRSVIP